MLTVVGQSHYENFPTIVLGHDDSLFFTEGLSPSTKDWFLLITVNDPGTSGLGWNHATDYRSGSYVPAFSQTFGTSGLEHAIVQAFGPGDSSFLSERSEFSTLEEDIISGDELVIEYVPSAGHETGNIGPRIYVGFKISGTLRNFQNSPPTEWYPNHPTGYSDIWAFEGFEESFPTGTTSTSVSMTLPAADRFNTLSGAAPKGQSGMLLAYVGWDASSSPTFTPDSGWIEEVYYDPADTFGLAVYTRLFGPDDNDYTFSGTLSSSVHWQAHIAAYQISGALHLEGARDLNIVP